MLVCWRLDRLGRNLRHLVTLIEELQSIGVGFVSFGEGITAEDMKTLRWVRPRVVIEGAFTKWTAGGNLRHASFVGLRDDKAPHQVSRNE